MFGQSTRFFFTVINSFHEKKMHVTFILFRIYKKICKTCSKMIIYDVGMEVILKKSFMLANHLQTGAGWILRRS